MRNRGFCTWGIQTGPSRRRNRLEFLLASSTKNGGLSKVQYFETITQHDSAELGKAQYLQPITLKMGQTIK